MIPDISLSSDITKLTKADLNLSRYCRMHKPQKLIGSIGAMSHTKNGTQNVLVSFLFFIIRYVFEYLLSECYKEANTPFLVFSYNYANFLRNFVGRRSSQGNGNFVYPFNEILTYSELPRAAPSTSNPAEDFSFIVVL